jgi:serine/threonine-protein kinase PknK
LPTIAQVFGVTDIGERSVLKRLRDVLRERRLLLVLDNFDQVLPAAASLPELLATCPGLTLLVTSRVPLQLRWEHLLRVAPLSVPDLDGVLPPLDVLAQVPSVALFVERARARRADFALTEDVAPLVAQLVVQLDGLPLALELAAARLDVLPLATIVRRVEDRLQLLRWEAPDLPQRQHSLQAAISWSYDVLSEAEQQLFRHLGVFLGQVVLEAVHAIEKGAVGAEGKADTADTADVGRTLRGLASLAEKSLILPGREEDEEDEEAMGGPAFGMLETTREYAWEQLDHLQELPLDRARHARYFLDLAERADPRLRQPGQRAWFLRLEQERHNLREALRWLLDQEAPSARAALRFATALGYFWRRRGHLSEGVRWLEEALDRALGASTEADTAVRASALVELGAILNEQGELDRAKGVLEEALALAQQRQDAVAIAKALTALGTRATFAGDGTVGARLLREALHRWQELGGDPHYIVTTLFFLSIAASLLEEDEDATTLALQALDWAETGGDDLLLGSAHLLLAVLARRCSEVSRAIGHIRRGLEVGVAFHDRWLLSVGARVELAQLGERADLARRARLLGASDALGQASSAPIGMWERLVADPNIARLREQIGRGELKEAYQQGRSLSFEEVADLARLLLEEVAPPPADAESSETTPADQMATEPSAHPQSVLSAREQEVLRLVAQGLSSKAIAQRLFISASTVNHHISSIFHKLGVDTRAQAVAVAAQQGLV